MGTKSRENAVAYLILIIIGVALFFSMNLIIEAAIELSRFIQL